jgi:hypothetical protein
MAINSNDATNSPEAGWIGGIWPQPQTVACSFLCGPLDARLNGRDAAEAQTLAIGCTLKRTP